VEAARMNRGRNTAILAVLAAALGAYLFFFERFRDAPAADAPDSPRGKVFDKLDAAKIEEIQIAAGSGETTTLRKVDNTWRVTAPVTVPADQAEASGAASNLATADVQRVVDEQPKDLAPFGLAKPRLTITFRAAGDKTPRTLLLGDKNPTGSDLYAKLPASPRVFLVSAYLEGTFDKGSFGFRDKRILTFDREKIDRLDVAAGTAKTTVSRQADTWSVVAPANARADFGVIEAVLSRLANGQMKSIAWDPDDRAAITALLGFVEREARAAGSDKIRTFAMNAAFRATMRAHHFSGAMAKSGPRTKMGSSWAYWPRKYWRVLAAIRPSYTQSLPVSSANRLTSAWTRRLRRKKKPFFSICRRKTSTPTSLPVTQSRLC